MSITSPKNCFIFILLLYSNVVKSYKEVKVREPVCFSNPLLYLRNK